MKGPRARVQPRPVASKTKSSDSEAENKPVTKQPGKKYLELKCNCIYQIKRFLSCLYFYSGKEIDEIVECADEEE